MPSRKTGRYVARVTGSAPDGSTRTIRHTDDGPPHPLLIDAAGSCAIDGVVAWFEADEDGEPRRMPDLDEAPADEPPELPADVASLSELTAFLTGAVVCSDFFEAVRMVDDSETNPGAMQDCHGVDVLVWARLRHLSRLGAARVLLHALCRLPKYASAFLRGAAALRGLPSSWTHDDASAAVKAALFAVGPDDDIPDTVTPAQMACLDIADAYFDDGRGAAESSRLAIVVRDVVHDLVKLTGGDGCELLGFYHLVCEESDTESFDRRVLQGAERT